MCTKILTVIVLKQIELTGLISLEHLKTLVVMLENHFLPMLSYFNLDYELNYV